jgi:hypothetical protein
MGLPVEGILVAFHWDTQGIINPHKPAKCPHGTPHGCSLCEVARWERHRKRFDLFVGVLLWTSIAALLVWGPWLVLKWFGGLPK